MHAFNCHPTIYCPSYLHPSRPRLGTATFTPRFYCVSTVFSTVWYLLLSYFTDTYMTLDSYAHTVSVKCWVRMSGREVRCCSCCCTAPLLWRRSCVQYPAGTRPTLGIRACGGRRGRLGASVPSSRRRYAYGSAPLAHVIWHVNTLHVVAHSVLLQIQRVIHIIMCMDDNSYVQHSSRY